MTDSMIQEGKREGRREARKEIEKREGEEEASEEEKGGREKRGRELGRVVLFTDLSLLVRNTMQNAFSMQVT